MSSHAPTANTRTARARASDLPVCIVCLYVSAQSPANLGFGNQIPRTNVNKEPYFSESPGDLTIIMMEKQIVIRLKNACVKNDSALLSIFKQHEVHVYV